MMISKTIPYTLVAFAVAFSTWGSQANAMLPDCQSASSDSDGDGYGWENRASCRVVQTTQSANSQGVVMPDCQLAGSDPDGDGFGWENKASCRVVNQTTTGSSVTAACSSASSDPDGDGFGWENNASCRVVTDTPSNTGSSTTYPACVSANSDPDGDGFGWENNATCAVTADSGSNPVTETGSSDFRAVSPAGLLNTGTPTFRWNALANVEMYTLAIADSQGNGYSYQIDPVRAGCQTGVGTCIATPDLAYYDNDLNWRVLTTIDGRDGPESNRIAVTTPGNENIQPVKSGECEAWPSVAYDKYVVLNNTWNSRTMHDSNWLQKIFVNEDNFGNVRPTWTYDWLGQFDGQEIEVKSYPEVLYGPKLGTHISGSKEETGLPEFVRDLPEFTVEYAYTETGTAERNVALESFFHDSCDIAGPCDPVDNRAYEMMIWVENPTIRTPGKRALTGVMIDDRLWDVYIKPDSNKHYIAFTAHNSHPTGTIHWNRFVEWTRDWTAENAERLGINVLSPDFCMGAIELGTEMWWGQGSFTLNRFDVSFDQ